MYDENVPCLKSFTCKFLFRYDRAELKTSDHRPVGALFSVDLRKVKHEGISTLVEDVIAYVFVCFGKFGIVFIYFTTFNSWLIVYVNTTFFRMQI